METETVGFQSDPLFAESPQWLQSRAQSVRGNDRRCGFSVNVPPRSVEIGRVDSQYPCPSRPSGESIRDPGQMCERPEGRPLGAFVFL